MTATPPATATRMLRAFCRTLEAGLDEAFERKDHRAARHQITVISETTLEVAQIAKRAGVRAAVAADIKNVIAKGHETSAAVSRICEECDGLYRSDDNETTNNLCGYCNAEQQYAGE